MKIHIDRFRANDPKLTIDDVVKWIKMGKDDTGIVCVQIETVDKYVDMDVNGTLYTPDFGGQVISMSPIIWDEESLQDLKELDYDRYLAHEKFWSAQLVVEDEDIGYTCDIVTPLKYEYMITYVPDRLALNYNCLKDADIVEWMNSDEVSDE